MSEEIEKLIKIQGVINNNRYHLSIRTDLEEKSDWRLYMVLDKVEDYLSDRNAPIMDSTIDTIDDLIDYLDKHNGFSMRW